MNTPPSVALARQVAPLLSGISWAIGGSTLLHRLGVEPRPHDLDLVVRDTDFEAAVARLTSLLGSYRRPSHPTYASQYFAKFETADGVQLDLLGGIAVHTPAGLVRWHFEPSRIEIIDGLPWMSPHDWVALYQLFGRPNRVAQLQHYLAGKP